MLTAEPSVHLSGTWNLDHLKLRINACSETEFSVCLKHFGFRLTIRISLPVNRFLFHITTFWNDSRLLTLLPRFERPVNVSCNHRPVSRKMIKQFLAFAFLFLGKLLLCNSSPLLFTLRSYSSRSWSSGSVWNLANRPGWNRLLERPNGRPLNVG